MPMHPYDHETRYPVQTHFVRVFAQCPVEDLRRSLRNAHAALTPLRRYVNDERLLEYFSNTLSDLESDAEGISNALDRGESV